MRGDNRFGKSRGLIILFACLAVLAGGCSESKPNKTDNGTFDSSRLPRVSGAKEIFASATVTNFTSPDSVAQTADTVEKALAAAGWQKYVAPNTSTTADPKVRIMSLKKGMQALNVFITIAPAQNNATSVQYSAIPLKTDLPFTKDASNIEYSPERPLLTLVTAEPVDKTLDFYRKELGARGWSLWSEKTNGKERADGPSGVAHERGGYAHYTTDKDPSVALVLTLQKADAGKYKLELKQWPAGVLEAEHQAYLNRDNSAPLVEVNKLPRLDVAKEQADRSSSDRLVYSVPDTLANTTAAIIKLLGTEGWKPYVAPLDDVHTTLMAFKKGAQGLSVSFFIQVGKNERTSEVTTVDYSPTRLQFALPFPDAATDIVFDTNRPYLNLVTTGSIESVRNFYNKQLLAAEWTPLSAADAAAKWSNAKFDDKPANGDLAYYIRGTQRPIVLALQARDGKVNVEIKVPSFALPQSIEADKEVYGLPRPKLFKTSGANGGDVRREVYAHIPAGVDTVLAFYRRELAARNWKEEAQGAVITPDEVVLNFTAPEGTAVLKIGHKYDLTIVSLVQQLPKVVAKVAPATGGDSIDAMLKEAQQMMRDATAEAQAGAKSQKMAQANEPAETLRPLADNDAPVPVPEGAEDIEFDSGRLEFSSGASVKSVADFYRSTMKQQGWGAQSSVINNANMVVLNFSKAGKSVSFTIMKMGNRTNVSADGSALKVAATRSAAPGAAPSDKAAATDTPSQPATEDDLIAEESGGLPMPKRHTMSEGTKTPFRRELNANVPLNLADVLGFYRRELGKLNWKEESKSAVIAADSAVIAFTAPAGPALLKLGRKDGETTVKLTVKDPGAAEKAGILPKAGQVKIMFGNINAAEAAITFNNRMIKVAAGAGTKAPDGPTLDLAPGKYKYSIKLSGRPAQSDEVEVGADEIWGLMIGPGGVLALQAY
jgi:hypothetical protein